MTVRIARMQSLGAPLKFAVSTKFQLESGIYIHTEINVKVAEVKSQGKHIKLKF